MPCNRRATCWEHRRVTFVCDAMPTAPTGILVAWVPGREWRYDDAEAQRIAPCWRDDGCWLKLEVLAPTGAQCQRLEKAEYF